MSFPHYTQLDQMDCGPTCLRMVAKHYGRLFTLQSLREKSQLNREGVSLLGIAEAAEGIGFRTMGVKIPFEKLATEAPLPCIVHWDQNHFVVVYGIKGAGSSWMNRAKGGRKAPEINGLDNDGTARPFAHSFQVDEGNIVFPPGGWSLPPAPEPQPLTKRRGTVFVADPGRGLISYSAEEFCQHWLSAQTGNQEEGVVLLLEPTPAFFEQDDEPATAYGFERVFGYLWQYKRLLVQLLVPVHHV